MIAYIIGKVHSFGLDYVIVENNGIGYRINYMHPENLTLNQEITVYTYQHVREDEISLFGFNDLKEYEIFMKLIDVKGIGPKTALNILSFIKPNELINVIENDDVIALKKLPGVGAKAASQIILDLKGKLVYNPEVNSKIDSNVEDALAALKNLGYRQTEINSIINELTSQKCSSSEEYLKLGLQLLLKRKGV